MHKIVHGIDYIWFTSIIFCPTRGGDGSRSVPRWPGRGRSNSQKTTLKYLGVYQKELVRDNGWRFLSSDSL